MYVYFRKHQRLLLDQRTTPLETAVYWTEYVIRNKGAYHLQTPARKLNLLQFYLIDVISVFLIAFSVIVWLVRRYINQNIDTVEHNIKKNL